MSFAGNLLTGKWANAHQRIQYFWDNRPDLKQRSLSVCNVIQFQDSTLQPNLYVATGRCLRNAEEENVSMPAFENDSDINLQTFRPTQIS